jgi:exodeoxyribonuclease V gamma subunit
VIHVHYSNRTEELLAALAAHLRAEARGASGGTPFEAAFSPARLVVPNRNVETYVKLGLAEAHGIAAHIEVSFLRGFLARVAECVVPGGRVVDLLQLEGHLFTLLHDEAFLAQPALLPVREDLLAAGAAPAAVDRRRCQLAAELAKLFDEYAGARPELLSAWAAGRGHFAEGVPAALEAWQRALWAAVFGAGGLTEARSRRDGGRWLPLPALLAEAEALGLPRGGRALHVFGVSYMARGYHRMLAALGRAGEVRIYTLNPCREFWEDVETVAELRRRLKKDARRTLFPSRLEARQGGLLIDEDPLGLVSEGENLALRLWGRPGRENVRLLGQQTDGDFDGRFQPSGAATLLGRLQDDILDRVARTSPDPALRADGTIAVLRCPGLRRELEVVAAEIWRLVRADPSLRFNDIAVVVPESRKEAYLSHVGAVFREAAELPHNVADLPLAGHRLGEAVELLLALPLGTFSRRDLLPLVTHPSVLARFPEASAADCIRLCEELGIVHGADHQDHAGTYIERDLYNWDQGLRRLALGALMTGPRAGDETPLETDEQAYLPADLPADAQAGALSFALLVRSLIADARFAAGGDGAPRLRPLPEWLELIRGMLASYLVPADDDEEALLGRCLRALQELDEVEVGAPVSYLVAADLARRAFARIGGTRGSYLARGVTVASFVPMRAIPFRAVFVVGLGHGLFPAGPRRGQLDLREVRRAPGDVSPREQDLYLFLETLLCARERLVLSYVARDELTGAALPPSSVLLELRELLGQGYLLPDELERLFAAPAPPLRRYDDADRLDAAPLARRESVAKRLGLSLRAALPPGAALPDLAALRRALPEAVRGRLEARLAAHGPPPARARERERLVVSLAAIRQFLEDPLQGSARFRLRMREVDDGDDQLEREDEPFETGALDRAELLREALVEALLAAPGVPSLGAVVAGHRRVTLREELAGRLPTGLFRLAERAGQESILKGWLQQLQAFTGEGPFQRGVTRFGPGGSGALSGAAHWLGRDGVARVCEPLRLELAGADGRPLAVEIVGRTELLVTPGAPGAAPASVNFVCRSRDEQKDRERLRGFVDHLALSAAGLSTGRHGAVTIWARGPKHRTLSSLFRPVSSARARAYLAAIVTDMITGARDAAGRPTGVHDYLLPFEGVMDADKSGRPVAEEVERLRDAYFEKPNLLGFSTVWGPVPEAVERHDPPPQAEAERMVAERFGLYFELLEGRNT